MRFSVIIPVYNDSEGIRLTIDSLLQLDYPCDRHEILIVDNNSDDNTRETAEQLAGEHGHIRVLVEDDIQSSYAARNTGIEAAEGELLAFIDADMTADPEWLTALDSIFSERGADYVGCDVQLYLPEDSKSSLVGQYNIATGFPMETYMNERQFVGAGCLAVRREVVEDVGGFDSDLVSGGDKEFGYRVAEAGYDQFYAGDIVHRHPARTSLKSLLKRAVRIGRGKSQLNQMYPEIPETRAWYHPFNVLPPHPRRFYKLVGDEYKLRTVFLFFFITYFYKFFVLYGRLENNL